jgi:methyl-accepting chemotaxis protein
MKIGSMTIGKKLLLFGILGSTIPVIALGAIALWEGNKNVETVSKECNKLAKDDLDHIVLGLCAMMKSHQENLQQKIASDLTVASSELSAMGGLTSESEKIKWQARNQFTSAEQTVELPQMRIGSQGIAPNADPKTASVLVDKINALTGSACTLFQRMNDSGDMLRIATTVKAKDGKRAINSFIPAVEDGGKANPVVKAVLNGQRFIGRAFVVDAWYVTAYEPVKDSEGKVVGMLFTGMPETGSQVFRDAFYKAKVGKTGYVYVLDSKGNYIISKDGKRDGELIWNAKDASGRLFIQEIVKKGIALKPGEIGEEFYPWKNAEDPVARMKIARIAYFEPWDWVVGAGSYEDEFYEAKTAIESANARSRMILIGILGACVIASAVGWLMISRGIVRPIRRTADMLKDIAEGDGDLTQRLAVENRDEVGDLACFFNNFVEKLQNTIGRVAANINTVASSATKLAETASQLAHGAEETTNQSAQVAAAAEQLSTNMHGMSSSTDEMSGSIKVIASAIEELTSSVSEIAKSAERAAGVAGNAAQLVSTSNEQIGELGSAADEIGKVIEVIQDIAEQTNLLALNATIEAARAGDAGKGFAVVATEVKELAKQTASATEDIRKKIEGIQSSTTSAVKSIGDISEVVKQVNELSRTIASAVEEQSITTKEIAKNVAQSSTAAQTVARNVTESATATQEITKTIVGVDEKAKQAAQGAQETQTTGRELSQIAEVIQSAIGRFKV